MTFKEGDRVKVVVKNRSLYARGCADSLNGKVGTVLAVKKDLFHPTLVALVSFDTPAPAWHSHQLPVTGFHIPLSDLKQLTKEE